MNVRRLIFVLGFILLIAALATSIVLAASPAQQTLTVTVAGCTSGSHIIGGMYAQQFETPTSVVISLRINGVVIFSNPGTHGVGSGGGGWGLSFFYATQPGDYDIQWEWHYTVGGETVWRNTAGFRCVGGAPTDIYATNEDLTLPVVNEDLTLPVVPVGCTLAVAAGSVVGEAPLGAQAFYEPGKESPGVVLNPGTYIVFGQDAGESFYKVMLACQFVWVQKNTMQPSFQPPQNGAPLPTAIVS